MGHTLRTICSVLLSLALSVMPLQSYAMIDHMIDTQVEQTADADDGCAHGSGMVEERSQCCASDCGSDCDASCTAHMSSATLSYASNTDIATSSGIRLSTDADLSSITPAPPSPPPLI